MLRKTTIQKITMAAGILMVCFVMLAVYGRPAYAQRPALDPVSDGSVDADGDDRNASTREARQYSENTVRISYGEDALTIECGKDSVRLNKDGLQLHEDGNLISLSSGGIFVAEGDNVVDISTRGIKISNGSQGEIISLELFGLPEIITDAQDELKEDWEDFYKDTTLFRKTIDFSGDKIRIKVRIQDGYLVTTNCSDEYTDIVGLTLEKTETDEKGNELRYYKK